MRDAEELRPDEREGLRPRRGESRWRTAVAAVLITIGCVLAPVAMVAVWASNEISDTDRYVDTVAPLAAHPAIQNAVANGVTTEVMRAVDVPAVIGEIAAGLEDRGLPPKVSDKLESLATPIAGGARGFVRDKVGRVVSGDAFQTVWTEAHRRASTQLNAILSGDGSRLQDVRGSTVRLELAPMIDSVKERLVAAGFGVAAGISQLNPTVELLTSDQLATPRAAYRLLNAFKWVLPIASLALITTGVLVARFRRRALIGAGLGLGAAMLLLAVSLAIGRGVFLGAVARNGLDQAAGMALFDTVIKFLRIGLRTFLVLGLVVALGAYFTGPSTAAVRARSTVKRMIHTVDLGTGRFGVWVYRYRTALRIGVVVTAALAFVFWSDPTGAVVLLLALIVLVLMAAIELLARKSPKPDRDLALT